MLSFWEEHIVILIVHIVILGGSRANINRMGISYQVSSDSNYDIGETSEGYESPRREDGINPLQLVIKLKQEPLVIKIKWYSLLNKKRIRKEGLQSQSRLRLW